MKMRGVASPNMADALCLSEMFYNVAHRVFRSKVKNKKDGRNPDIYPELHSKRSNSQHSWMVY